MPRRPATITQADVPRVIRAAKQVARPPSAPTLSARPPSLCSYSFRPASRQLTLVEDGTVARNGYHATHDGAKCLERIA